MQKITRPPPAAATESRSWKTEAADVRELLLACPASVGDACARDVFVRSSAGYVRNLDGVVFPRKAVREELETIRERVLSALDPAFTVLRMEDADGAVTGALAERGYVTRSEADEPNEFSSRALALRDDGCDSCFVNGTDHVRLACRLPGFSVGDAFRRLRLWETVLDERLRFAASLQFGYLTALPEDCGSALHLGVRAFLPGIRAAGVFDRVVRDLLASGIEPRIFGEDGGPENSEGDSGGSSGKSPFVELSARAPLGADEESFVERFIQSLRSLAEGERRTRARVLERERLRLEDAAYRAAATLRAARMLSAEESLRLLSDLRAGIAFGVAPSSADAGNPYERVDALLILVAPGHVRLRAQQRNADNKAVGGDEMRSSLVRELLPHYLIG
jgi:protein arginine kinase